MWIRSQDSKTLVNTDNVSWFEVMKIDGKYAVAVVDGGNSISIAYYHTEESAIDALIDMSAQFYNRWNEPVILMPEPYKEDSL